MNTDNQYQYWDSVAGEKNFTHPLNEQLLAKFTGVSDAIIDYGCGYGRVVQRLIELGYGAVTGFDTSAKLVERGVFENGSVAPPYQGGEEIADFGVVIPRQVSAT